MHDSTRMTDVAGFCCSSTLDIGIKMMRNKSAQPRIFFGVIPFFKAH